MLYLLTEVLFILLNLSQSYTVFTPVADIYSVFNQISFREASVMCLKLPAVRREQKIHINW